MSYHARLIDIFLDLSNNNRNGPVLTDQNGNKYKINSLVNQPDQFGHHPIYPSFYYADVEFDPGKRTIRATPASSAPGSGKLLYTITSGWHP